MSCSRCLRTHLLLPLPMAAICDPAMAKPTTQRPFTLGRRQGPALLGDARPSGRIEVRLHSMARHSAISWSTVGACGKSGLLRRRRLGTGSPGGCATLNTEGGRATRDWVWLPPTEFPSYLPRELRRAPWGGLVSASRRGATRATSR